MAGGRDRERESHKLHVKPEIQLQMSARPSACVESDLLHQATLMGSPTSAVVPSGGWKRLQPPSGPTPHQLPTINDLTNADDDTMGRRLRKARAVA